MLMVSRELSPKDYERDATLKECEWEECQRQGHELARIMIAWKFE